ncbi:MAG TPA: hypothetical protein VFC31_11505 [Candidatus Limnocylindria bacterium]|nr:hypothetical protein [Candidatus Limnocylindria bacterium]
MTWRYDEWKAAHDLPVGVSERAPLGQQVRAGDVIATGTTYGAPVRVAGARHIGVAPRDLGRVMRVSVGAEVKKGMVVARTGRRFARAVSSPIDGRIAHVRGDGDIEIAPIVDRWTVRSTLDGRVTESTESTVTVEGSAWCLQAVAAFGPDAIGELALAVGTAGEEIVPSRVDVTQRGRILVAGGRSGAEAIARAHACGVAAVVAGAVPAAGLRAVFGDATTAHGAPSQTDLPTVLCLLGFGSAQLPLSLFAPFRDLASARAAIHTASARLFVFAAAGAVAIPMPSSVALHAEWGAVRPLDGPVTMADETRFASERSTRAVMTSEGPVPAANVIALAASR